ncbi:HTH-type transcriptional repressor FabR [Bowmanella sp. JS7-9]|uniref:HTH-type transcriptional repressor FabR n=1 Tax=Pseudobowmanella zhangzhouensis TaxID=1537679 RepID=A0ABW1XL31_9ALTE|nr:HTH-type transcriptional repressor FabR [Bowmanella sp. JS7-9]TBX20542.1 hypothetical protein TK45_14595 [Bowmanella sp. JS7-9]
MNRQEQKRRTRHAIINAAFNLLSEERSLSSISLREVAREAGIAPTSFYRHFADMDELGLTLVDEGGLALRQLMRQARQRIESGGDVIKVSVTTFLEFVTANANAFRLLLRERSGTSIAFRDAVAREIKHFTLELTDYIETHTQLSEEIAALQADAMVKLVFAAGADVIDMNKLQRQQLADQLIRQLRIIAIGAAAFK